MTTVSYQNDPVIDDAPTQRPLRRGDLVRVSELGQRTSKRLKDRSGHLGRIIQCKPMTTTDVGTANDTVSHEPDHPSHPPPSTTTTYSYDVDWVLGGQSKNLLRHELIWTNAEQEGMTNAYTTQSRTKRKPMDYMTETIQKDQIKQQQKQLHRKNKNNTPLSTEASLDTAVMVGTSPTTASAGKKRKLTSLIQGSAEDAVSTTLLPSPPLSSQQQQNHNAKGKAVVTATTTTQKGKRVKQQQQQKSHGSNDADAKGTSTKKKSNTTVKTVSSSTASTGKTQKPNTTVNHKKGSKSSVSKTVDPVSMTAHAHTTTSSTITTTTTTTTTITTTDIPTSTALLTSSSSNFDMYERHRREFERMFLRLKTKIDYFHHFWKDNQSSMENVGTIDAAVTVTPEFINTNDTSNETASPIHHQNTDGSSLATDTTPSTHLPTTATNIVAPILNWESIQQHMDEGRYILDRIRKEEIERQQLFGDSFSEINVKKNIEREASPTVSTHRVFNPKGVHWELFRSDVFAMCDTVLELRRRQQPPPHSDNDDNENNTMQHQEDVDDGQKGSVSYSIRKIKEAVQLAVDRTGRRHESEMKFADDRYKYTRAIESYHNTEPAMQSWRKIPYPERIYERLNSDVVCAGLSEVDERIAAYELKTSLPNSFIGQSYRYDDTGQSEAWMKSVVDETGYKAASKKSNKRRASYASSNGSVGDDAQKAAEQERLAALALSADEGVTRAQVSATMQSLLIAVQDRVMTERNVLKQPELRSANWFANDSTKIQTTNDVDQNSSDNPQQEQESSDLLPEIIEQPVWGIDCYTRRNIMCCLGTEFDTDTSLLFIEKWLLPAINACPENLGHNITNAARILEGLPLDEPNIVIEDDEHSDAVLSPLSLPKTATTSTRWSESLLGRALLHKISVAGPLWLKAAANQLRCACDSMGPDFFRVHPKGNGSVVLSASLKPNTLVTFYRGELYPSWRWGEKMDAIDITQSRKDLKPALPDFYNMALERPQTDPRGYGLLFVDASRKAGHGSSLSHSCAPTCEVRVAACDGELCLAMTTLRELEMGEELTFDYNAVTESLNEYRSAVCLCGYGKCRGSFLHFATADCYQQVLNRNSPIASRFSSMIKGSMKQVMSPDDEQILRSHGFLTAAFGAISVNRRADKIAGISDDLVDSLDIVPVWLRTYVADALRYIEYERRALPIALICEHLSTSSSKKVETDDIVENLVAEPSKERKQASSFFYFLNNQSDLLRDLMKKEGFPETLKGLQFRHAMQKVASNYWSGLPDERKKYWKEQAQLDFEKKNNENTAVRKKVSADHQNGVKKKTKDVSADEKRKLTESKKGKSKPEIQDILHSSKISFQDADAEGVVAMEQRIQQLTQTLSRVGRVLDRHREGLFASNPRNIADAEQMRKLVHAPVKVLSDADVIHWIWQSEDGVVLPLLREVKSSRFVRPSLHQSLRDVWAEHASFDVSNGRRQLKEGLLTLRAVILKELRETSRELRQFRVQSNSQQSEEPRNPAPAVFSDNDSEENVPPDIDLYNTFGDIKKSTTFSHVNVDDNIASNDTGLSKLDVAMNRSHPWLEFYGERFILQSAADVLLMYAYTSNFFVFQPYLPLESTPVEVYARELGNSVSRAAIDNGLSCEPEREELQSNCNLTTKLKLKSGLDATSSPEKSLTVSCTGSKSSDSDICAPDDIVAKVTIRYDGNYVSSQLLQWYNAGIGQKPGLPDLLGCALLPRISDCWQSKLVKMNKKTKGDGKTKYELKVRPRLVEWMQDPYERGNPWPSEIRNAFIDETRDDSPEQFVAFGSPIIDFLVMGDESNIIDILYELDADDKITAKKSADGLLTSLDKGRPAQAVSTWVQCEDPKCMKWRKIPWYVDADLLPERFFCKDNMWNPSGNSCDTPEDDWDKDDAMVGSDGKVEGSPVNKKKFEGSLPVDEESSFRIGARFDVQRSDKSVFSIATVVKVDFSGSIKRIMFHYAKTSSDRDEWVEFGSTRVAPLYTKVPKKRISNETKLSPTKESVNSSQNKILKKKRPKSAAYSSAHETSNGNEWETSPRKKQKVVESRNTGTSIQKARCTVLKVAADPLDKNSYVVGAQFDVFREDKQRFCSATVVEVDCNGPTMRICFRFPKTKDNHREWLDFGSPHICSYKSKITRKEPKDPKEDVGSLVASDTIDESSFFVGAQFDVYRKEKKRHCRAVVCELDYADGRLSGICFKYSDDNKEWMVFGARTIFPFKSKLKKRVSKVSKVIKTLETNPMVAANYESGAQPGSEIDGEPKRLPVGNAAGHANVAMMKTPPRKIIQRRDPANLDSFVVGASFDVFREDKRRYCWAVVEDVDVNERTTRIYFRFKKSKDNHVEWIDFGSSRICTYKSKTARKDPKKQLAERNAGAADKDKSLNGKKTMSTEIAAEAAPNDIGNRTNDNTMKAPPSNDSDDERVMNPNVNITSSSILNIGTNGSVIQSYDPFSNHDSSAQSLANISVPTQHRLPDFFTPPNVSSFTLDNSRLPQPQQHTIDNNSNHMHSHGLANAKPTITTEAVVSQFPVAAAEKSLETSYRSGGSIPAGWSGLDILAAVTFDAATTTTTTTPTSSADLTLSNGPVQPSSSWGGGNTNSCSSMTYSNHVNSISSNGNHHLPAWQNQQRFIPMWPQQQAQLSDQRWLSSMDSTVRISQQQLQQAVPTTTSSSTYDDRMNHSFLSQQPQSLAQQQWHNAAPIFNGDQSTGSTNVNSSNNNIDHRYHPSANQHYTRYE